MFADDLEAWFVGRGLISGAFIGTAANVPDTDGPHTVIVETAGPGAEFVQDVAGASMMMPGAQVSVRHVNPLAAQTLATSLWLACTEAFNVTINGVWYRQIRSMQTPFDMGFDSTGKRTKFGFNVIGDKKPS